MSELELPPNPHDAFVKVTYQKLKHARALLRSYLPPELAKIIRWSTLRLERDAFVSDLLSSQFADLVFSVCFRGDSRRRRLRLLFEHKRQRRKGTPRQVHRYISRQFEDTADNDPLPCIVTVVLLQSGRLSETSLAAEYKLPPNVWPTLSRYVPNFELVPIELSRLEEADLHGTEIGRLTLAMLKSVGAGRLDGWLEYRSILTDLCQNLPPERLREELRPAIYYLASVAEPQDEPALRQSLLSLPDEFGPMKEPTMTLLEHLEKRGEERGVKLGEEQGARTARTEMSVRQLSKAYSAFTSDDAERVRNLSDESLDELADLIAVHRPWQEIRHLLRDSSKQRPADE